MFSRRLFVFFMACAIPLLPLIKAEIEKIAQVKSADYYRLIIWKDALRVWSKQPIFGVGQAISGAMISVSHNCP